MYMKTKGNDKGGMVCLHLLACPCFAALTAPSCAALVQGGVSAPDNVTKLVSPLRKEEGRGDQVLCGDVVYCEGTSNQSTSMNGK